MASIRLAVRGVRLRLFGSVTAPSSPESPVELDEPSPRFASSHTASSRSTRFHSCGRSPPCSTESVLWELETSEDAECSLVASLPLLASPYLSVMSMLTGYSLRRVFARVVGAEHHDSCGADVVAPVPCWLHGRLVCSGHPVSHESDQRLTLTAVELAVKCRDGVLRLRLFAGFPLDYQVERVPEPRDVKDRVESRLIPCEAITAAESTTNLWHVSQSQCRTCPEVRGVRLQWKEASPARHL